MAGEADEYRFLCWLAGKVPSAKVIRDLFRQAEEGAREMNGSEMVEQLSLIGRKHLLEMKAWKIHRIAGEIVKETGNESEKYGLAVGLIPEWAHIQAKIIFEQALLKAKKE